MHVDITTDVHICIVAMCLSSINKRKDKKEKIYVYIFDYIPTEFLLHFEDATYSVNEGMNISVCFILENPPPPEAGFEFQFNVTVLSSDGSARGK